MYPVRVSYQIDLYHYLKITIYLQTIIFECQLQLLSLFVVIMVHKGGILKTGSQIWTLVYQEPAPCLIIPYELSSILKMVLYPVHMYTQKRHVNGLRTPQYG